jgi:hypothetical protein
VKAKEEDKSRVSIGDCYGVCALVMLEADCPASFRLCHGYPMNSVLGKRMGHAWIEDSKNSKQVFDAAAGSRGLKCFLDRGIYYTIGQIEARYVKRYTKAQVRKMIVRNETYGPWVEDPYPEVLYA